MHPIRRVTGYVKPYWWFSLLSIVTLLIMVFLDLALPRLIQRIIDQGIKANNLSVVVNTALLMLGISLVSVIVTVANSNFSIRVGESVARDLRETIFLKIQSFSNSNLDHHSTGNLMVRLTSDTAAVQRWVQVSLRIGSRAPLMIIGSIILMFNTSPKLALAIVPILVVTLLIIILFSTRMEPLFKKVQQKLDRLNTVLQENIAGARLIKAFVRSNYEGDRFGRANEDLTHDNTRVMQLMSTMNPALTVFVNLGIVLVVWMGGLQSIHGSLTIGQLVAFTNYLLTTMSPLLLMTNLSNTWANGLASERRIIDVLDTVSDVQDSPQAVALPADAKASVQFKDVSFHYEGNDDRDVLREISLLAKPGETVAILGATGAGKSSLINLIPRFYNATAGQILIDNMNVQDLNHESILSQVALVPQESILFSGTVRENICYGKPDASDEEVFAAAKAAQAHQFILQLPQGYDTHVEERGVNLSGGQKQRIAIARALIMKPRILILDDSSSAVDIETETKIQKALEKFMHDGCTTFVVAQRISTVLNADKIVVLDKGKIAAEGTHAELMKSSPIYQEIYESQLGNGFRTKAVKTQAVTL